MVMMINGIMIIKARFLALCGSGVSRRGNGAMPSVMVFISHSLVLVNDLRTIEPADYRAASFRTDVGREFQTDGSAVLKERLLKDVRLKETCNSGADDDRSDRVMLRMS